MCVCVEYHCVVYMRVVYLSVCVCSIAGLDIYTLHIYTYSFLVPICIESALFFFRYWEHPHENRFSP